MTADVISMTGNRKNNQDSLLACGEIYTKEEFLFRSLKSESDRPQLFAIADGMGGEKHGEIASETVLEILNDELEPVLQASDNLDVCAQAVVEAIQKAQKKIDDEMNKKNSTGGTTISILLLHNGRFIALNIGDSPIYLVRKRKMAKLSREHTLAQMKIDDGTSKRQISESDYHCLVQCIGSGGYCEINVSEGQYFSGDTFAVMSDGMALRGERKVKKFLCDANKWKHMEIFKNAEDNVSGIIINV